MPTIVYLLMLLVFIATVIIEKTKQNKGKWEKVFFPDNNKLNSSNQPPAEKN